MIRALLASLLLALGGCAAPTIPAPAPETRTAGKDTSLPPT